MTEVTRRSILATSAGVAAVAGFAGRAGAGEGQPDALTGAVDRGKIRLPPLHNQDEGGETITNPTPPGKRLGVAVVGLGHLAFEQILPAFGAAKSVRLAALVSGHPEKARVVAAQHGLPDKAIYDYGSFDRIKNDPDVDIVYIVLPNALHADFTERAAAAGKHVLCEKPMATSVADAERMVKSCRDAGRKLMIAYRLQYDATHRALIDRARAQTFGSLRLIEAVNGQNDAPNGQWRQIKALAGGGSLPDVGLYCTNAFRYITGEEPIEVTGQITQPKEDPRFREIEDLATFTLRFPSGVLATGTSGYSFHSNRQLRCMADRGWFGSIRPSPTTVSSWKSPGSPERLMPGRRAFGHRRTSSLSRWIISRTRSRQTGSRTRRARRDCRTSASWRRSMNRRLAGVIKLPAASKLDATRGPLPAQND